MSVQERADLTQRLCVDVERLARAGIVARYPSYSEIEICHERSSAIRQGVGRCRLLGSRLS
jgi:hypothetical protein